MAADLPKIALPKIFIVIEELPKMGSGKIDFRTVTNIVRQKLASDKKQTKSKSMTDAVTGIVRRKLSNEKQKQNIEKPKQEADE